jgi:hypothetical protein
LLVCHPAFIMMWLCSRSGTHHIYSRGCTVNYYLGQEHPDFELRTNRPPNLPTLEGMPFEPIVNLPSGKLNIIDSYATWSVTPKLTVGGEGELRDRAFVDDIRLWHTDEGGAYVRSQWTPKVAVAARREYLSDHGGLFSNKTQAPQETTASVEYKFSQGFMMSEEWRRDWSN